MVLIEMSPSDDGSMTNDKRQVALESIKNDPRIAVILISFKAGSTGLNLTCCNNVILLDLWWYVILRPFPILSTRTDGYFAI